MLKQEKIDVIISSPLQRCLDTIAATAKYHNLEIITDERITEINTGKADGKPYLDKTFKIDEPEGEE